MNTFHNITLSEVYKETDDTTVLAFDVPKELKKEFNYRQGQFLTLRATIDGEDVRRSYSLCSSPLDDEWKVAVKEIYQGKFSTFVNRKLKAGDSIQVAAPSGDFGIECYSEAESKNYVAFAAGSGITPMLSIIKTHLKKEPLAKFKLFYLNRTASSIIFKEEIEALKNQYLSRFEVFYFLSREHRDIPLFNGRFDKEKMQTLTQTLINAPHTDHAFICGPEEMIFLIRDELVAAGMKAENVHYELFVSGLSEEDKARAAAALEQKVDGVEVTIIDGSKEFHFVLGDDHDNVLDGAIAAGADLPYACKGGVCSTCKCKVKEGSVAMKVNYALTEEEVAKGLVLSCVSVPTSKKLVVDYDV
ncbi:2Fe-2S iron-sulfur cluster-binding protein [Nonlabens tegetincola]|uniref:2Fe-2S iron-sulfur cluster-binding protein n=1 Tax=Nonlabens tegetincola TaxID=323273 RepID=UPI000CF381E1|nr:2Fe-2S iron-sulfur cluster-binding protein [Nonlabens tegetincola]PQJ14178.1 phenylacetic acid degradation protein [Nonlabens tegetincola]